MQAVQAAHAALSYSVSHPETTRAWHEGSQILVLLSVPDEAALYDLADTFFWIDIDHVAFHEPDLDGELTAIAVHPDGARWLTHLPLALRGGEQHDRT